ncbi:TlpA family protein disulfide reductase [Rubrivirga sp.]|uniref:TlpA family protein disulfide reductase n=1 Tax=Rubrivirga sp. TaxID=1885344 RepID=UPI003B51F4A0
MAAFAFAALGDTATVYTPETFAGRFVLVDFWASWCVPCHTEIPRIAAARAEHADVLDVLSVSLDLYPDDVAAFRARVAPMDWHHAFVGERFDHPSLVALGADRLPYAVLIGPDGTVRARGGALRHDRLAVTVAREIAASADAHAP